MNKPILPGQLRRDPDDGELIFIISYLVDLDQII